MGALPPPSKTSEVTRSGSSIKSKCNECKKSLISGVSRTLCKQCLARKRSKTAGSYAAQKFPPARPMGPIFSSLRISASNKLPRSTATNKEALTSSKSCTKTDEQEQHEHATVVRFSDYSSPGECNDYDSSGSSNAPPSFRHGSSDFDIEPLEVDEDESNSKIHTVTTTAPIAVALPAGGVLHARASRSKSLAPILPLSERLNILKLDAEWSVYHGKCCLASHIKGHISSTDEHPSCAQASKDESVSQPRHWFFEVPDSEIESDDEIICDVSSRAILPRMQSVPKGVISCKRKFSGDTAVATSTASSLVVVGKDHAHSNPVRSMRGETYGVGRNASLGLRRSAIVNNSRPADILFKPAAFIEAFSIPEIVVDPDIARAELEIDDFLFGNFEEISLKSQIWHQNHSEKWRIRKMKEIETRGGRKARFGVLITPELFHERYGKGFQAHQDKKVTNPRARKDLKPKYIDGRLVMVPTSDTDATLIDELQCLRVKQRQKRRLANSMLPLKNIEYLGPKYFSYNKEYLANRKQALEV